MGDIGDHIKARRSIRRFTEEALQEGQIQALLEAAMAAPSASNRRPWAFVVVTERERLQRLRAGLPFGRHAAPVALVVCGDLHRAYPGPPRDFWVQDCSAAMQNILLAAAGTGLGAVWIGVHPIGAFVAHVQRVLQLPEHVRPLGVALVGHPAELKPARTQYDPSCVHHEAYGSSPVPRRRRWWWPFG